LSVSCFTKRSPYPAAGLVVSAFMSSPAGEQGQGGFVVPVEVKFINNTIGHGVFAVDPIKKGTLLWTSKCVTSHTIEEATAILEALSPM